MLRRLHADGVFVCYNHMKTIQERGQRMAIRNPYGITVRTIEAGADYVLLVTGGQAHIGATAVSYPAEGGVHTEVIGLPGHKEAELARELADLACSRLGKAVTVVAGIHIDHATLPEIRAMVVETKALFQAELEVLTDRRR
jgi:gallate decarboxylase subunit D